MDGLPTSAPLPSSAHGIATTGASGAGAPDGGGPSWGGAYGGGFPSGQAHVWEFVEAMARLFRDGDAWAASHCIIGATVSCATLRAVANAVAIRCALAAFALSVLLEHPPNSGAMGSLSDAKKDFTEECKYGMLENECNSAFRECIKSIALKNGIQTETERTHTKRRRLGSRQILRLLYDSLATAPHDTGDSTFKIIDFVKVVSTGSGMVSSRRGLEAFCDKRNHVLASISVDRPADHMMLSSLFYEQARLSTQILVPMMRSRLTLLDDDGIDERVDDGDEGREDVDITVNGTGEEDLTYCSAKETFQFDAGRSLSEEEGMVRNGKGSIVEAREERMIVEMLSEGALLIKRALRYPSWAGGLAGRAPATMLKKTKGPTLKIKELPVAVSEHIFFVERDKLCRQELDPFGLAGPLWPEGTAFVCACSCKTWTQKWEFGYDFLMLDKNPLSNVSVGFEGKCVERRSIPKGCQRSMVKVETPPQHSGSGTAEVKRNAFAVSCASFLPCALDLGAFQGWGPPQCVVFQASESAEGAVEGSTVEVLDWGPPGPVELPGSDKTGKARGPHSSLPVKDPPALKSRCLGVGEASGGSETDGRAIKQRHVSQLGRGVRGAGTPTALLIYNAYGEVRQRSNGEFFGDASHFAVSPL
ncbi:hypothetical protein AK812_SmicGene12644 [Symbiodinium microadriaticum]|uniref:Uncharacterized protein n=1 Tax=Symbiodinium microadriaticum TaxID=2951 RepID=A0A1Q9EA30_SYMMI|nr:hypothetical protein AK812_SmicGene12644 [Symbiodinium microadriaticum]